MMDVKKPLAKAEEKPLTETKAPVAESKTQEAAETAEVKTEPAKRATRKTGTRKTTARKTAAAKTTEKKERKTPGRKPGTKNSVTKVHVQYAGKSYTVEDLMSIMKDVWVYDLNQKEADLRNVELYVKPEENAVYYVVGGISGRFVI